MTLHIGSMMQDAIDAAGEFLSEQHILFDVSELLALMESVIPKEQRAVNSDNDYIFT